VNPPQIYRSAIETTNRKWYVDFLKFAGAQITGEIWNQLIFVVAIAVGVADSTLPRSSLFLLIAAVALTTNSALGFEYIWRTQPTAADKGPFPSHAAVRENTHEEVWVDRAKWGTRHNVVEPGWPAASDGEAAADGQINRPTSSWPAHVSSCCSILLYTKTVSSSSRRACVCVCASLRVRLRQCYHINQQSMCSSARLGNVTTVTVRFFFWVTAFLELDQQMATDIVGQCSITMRWACRSWPTCSRVDNGSVVHGSWVKLVTISGWVTRASSRDLLTHDSVDQIYPKLSAQWLKWSCQGELPHQTVKNIDHL